MKKILIVDDSCVLQNSLSLLLSYDDYKVTQTTSSLQALELVERDKPEIIILNGMMLEIDGFEVCRKIKASPTLSNCFILLSTPHGNASDRVDALNAGANGYLPQPFCPTELMSTLSGVRSKLLLEPHLA